MSLDAKIVSEIEHFKDRIIKDFPYFLLWHKF